MIDTPPHLKTLEAIERECLPGLVEVLRWEGIEAVRYALWDMTNWHADYALASGGAGPPRNRKRPAGRCGLGWRR